MGTIASKWINTIDTNTLIHAWCRRTIIDIYKMYIFDIHWIWFGHYVNQMIRSYLFRNPFLWTRQGRDIDRMLFHLGIHHRYCKDFPCSRQYLMNENSHYDWKFKNQIVQMLKKQYNILILQSCPMKPWVQWQVNELMPSSHCPSFWHGFDWQSSMSWIFYMMINK